MIDRALTTVFALDPDVRVMFVHSDPPAAFTARRESTQRIKDARFKPGREMVLESTVSADDKEDHTFSHMREYTRVQPCVKRIEDRVPNFLA